MARPRVYKTEAVVVRQSPIGEADRVLNLLSPDYGQIRAVAKGVRRPSGRLTGHVELLNRVRVSVAEGRNLDVITEAEGLDAYPRLRQDLTRVSAAMYLAELSDGLAMPEGHNPPDAHGVGVYRLLVETLTRLDTGGPVDRLVPYFQMSVLSLSGLAPELSVCVECGRRLERRDHTYCAGAGGIACPACITGAPGPFLSVTVNAVKVLRYYQAHPMGEALELDVPTGMMTAVRKVLDAHLRHHLDREIKSARFLDTVQSAT